MLPLLKILPFLPDIPAWIEGLLLFMAACVGHTFFWVTALNVFYAWPLPHAVMRVCRKIDILIVLAGPPMFWLALANVSWDYGTAGFVWTPYLVFCWILGFIVAPACMVHYALRRTRAQLRFNHCQIVNVEQELGYRPVGRGKKRNLCNLPLNQVFQVEIVRRSFILPQLPKEWHGLKILHLSDLHFCGTPDKAFYHHVLARAQENFMPDIVALTGDFVDTDTHYRWIVPILGRLRWSIGAFAVLGNHDTWYEPALVRRRLRKLRIDVLGNSWKQIDVRGVPMVVIGNEYPWFKPLPDLTGCPADVFRLCLSHSPDQIAWARRNRVDLMLAGHVHGGQIRLPFIGSLFVPSRYSRRYDCGTFFETPTLMHVSRGLAGQHPIRINCKPEVTQIVLGA